MKHLIKFDWLQHKYETRESTNWFKLDLNLKLSLKLAYIVRNGFVLVCISTALKEYLLKIW